MSAATIIVSQTRYNLLATTRAGSAIALGVVMPVVFYLGASALFGSETLGGDNPVEVRNAGETPNMRAFYVGGFTAYAAVYAAFVALLPDIVDIRERGLLKRLRGTPLPLSAFVAARFVIALLITTIGVTVIAALGWVVFDVPTRAGAFVGLAVYTLAGTVTFACLAVAATTITRTQSGAQGLSNGIGIVLAMISGVFFEPSILPDAVRTIAQHRRSSHSNHSPTATNPNTPPTPPTSASTPATSPSSPRGPSPPALLVALRGFRWKPHQQR